MHPYVCVEGTGDGHLKNGHKHPTRLLILQFCNSEQSCAALPMLPLWSQERALLLASLCTWNFTPACPPALTLQTLTPCPPMHPPRQARTCQDGLVNPEGGGFDGEDADICRDFVPHCGESREK